MMVRDPVCGKEVDPLRARSVGVFGGRFVYFCCPEHREAYGQGGGHYGGPASSRPGTPGAGVRTATPTPGRGIGAAMTASAGGTPSGGIPVPVSTGKSDRTTPGMARGADSGRLRTSEGSGSLSLTADEPEVEGAGFGGSVGGALSALDADDGHASEDDTTHDFDGDDADGDPSTMATDETEAAGERGSPRARSGRFLLFSLAVLAAVSILYLALRS